jgi:superfamily I DNA/RNA helicase
VLAPNFRAFARLDERIDMYDRSATRVLTEEQERILAETELDKRKVFFGAAGSGKTFLAMEKAKRLDKAGRRVLLTCFNKDLAAYFRENMPHTITCANFHDHLQAVLAANGQPLSEPDEGAAKQRFFERTLPDAGFDYYYGADAAAKYDSVIVDEGQDFREDWFVCLEAMLRDPKDGEFYVFADPNQDLFGVDLSHLRRLPLSKHRLIRNLRNSETISDWLLPFIHDGSLKPVLRGGVPVVTHRWGSQDDERHQVEQEVGRLVSQGIRPQRILILSPNRREHSCFAGRDRIKEWPLADHRQASPGAVRFATIRSFKGLEADIVLMIGLSAGNHACTDADIYVGGSRARFILHLFCDAANPPVCLKAR